MKKYGILLLLFSLFFACGNGERPQIDISEVPVEQRDSVRNEVKNKLNETYGFQLADFQMVEASNYIFFPVQIAGEETKRNKFSRLDINHYEDYSVGKCWNILFYDTQNKNYYSLLSDTVGVIEEYAQFAVNPPDTLKNKEGEILKIIQSPYEYQGNYASKFMFYEIKFDHNQDGKLDSTDPVQLYISDKTGKKFRALTPPNTDLVSWNFYKKSNLIIVKARKDTNDDQKFNELDNKNRIFEIDLKNPKMGTPIFAEKFIDDLKGMMLEKHFLRE